MRVGPRVGSKRFRQIAVDLDHIHVFGPRQQAPGQSAAAGSYFDQALSGRRRNAIDDAANDAGIVQEVLAETFTNLHGVYSRP
jgi:hypothetical protein